MAEDVKAHITGVVFQIRVLPAGVEHCYGCGGHNDLPRHCKLRIPQSMSTGDRLRVLTSGVKRETTQTLS